MRRVWIPLLSAALAVTSFCDRATAQIIPEDRRIEWVPGIPGGIPSYPIEYDVMVDFGAVGDGVTNDTSAFAEALAAATPGHAVYVPEGTYLITTTLALGGGVVIRGAGPARTLIHSQHDHATFSITGEEPVAVTTLSTAAGKDAQIVEVASSDGLSAGDLVQLARPEEVQQIVEIADVSGSQLTLSGLLYSDFPAGSTVARHNMIDGAGVEDMKIFVDWPELDGYNDTHKVWLANAKRCWVKNIETAGYSGDEVLVDNAYRCEVRDSYFHHELEAALAQNQFSAYGVELRNGASDCLVENNIFNIFRHAMVIQYDNAGGNVFGYNMSWDSYTINEETGHTERTLGIGDIEFHHQQVEAALFEGNHAECARMGSFDAEEDYAKRHNTLLRNRFTQSGVKSALTNNLVGNELPEKKYEVVSEHWYPENQFDVDTETLVHGNYIVFDNQGISWDPTIADHDIPSSYYYSEKPAWFCDLLWPAFGGDLMPDNTRRSPTEVRFWSILFPEVAPSDLALTVQGSEVQLSWTNNSTHEVDFVVARGSGAGNFERIGETSDTTFVDTGYAGTESLWYFVRARNHLGGENGDALGGESRPSNVVSTDPSDDTSGAPDCVLVRGGGVGVNSGSSGTGGADNGAYDSDSEAGCDCGMTGTRRTSAPVPWLLMLSLLLVRRRSGATASESSQQAVVVGVQGRGGMLGDDGRRSPPEHVLESTVEGWRQPAGLPVRHASPVVAFASRRLPRRKAGRRDRSRPEG